MLCAFIRSRIAPLILLFGLMSCQSQDDGQGVHILKSSLDYDVFRARLISAINDNGLIISEGACGKCSIKTIEISKKNTEIISVYEKNLTLRMMQAGAAAGGDIPLRFYLTKLANGTAKLTYHQPSKALAIYNAPKLKPIGERLDRLFEKIVEPLH